MKIRALALAVGLAAAAQAHASGVVFSDDFDADGLGLNAAPAGWTVTGGTVDVIGTPGFYDFLPGNGHYLDLDGSTSQAGLLSTTLDLAANTTYVLSFDMAGSQRGSSESVTVDFGGVSTVVGTSSLDPFAAHTLTFTTGAAGSYTLSFQDHSADNIGALLDNVQVTAVPEPASVLLMLAGLGAVGGVARRRRRG